MPPQIMNYQRECEKRHGLVGVKGERYMEGHSEGLLLFCTLDGGFEYGKKGRHYQQVCPRELEPTFLKGYLMGQKVYVAIKARKSAEKAAKKAKEKAKEAEHKKKGLLDGLAQDRKQKKRREEEQRKLRDRQMFGRR